MYIMAKNKVMVPDSPNMKKFNGSIKEFEKEEIQYLDILNKLLENDLEPKLYLKVLKDREQARIVLSELYNGMIKREPKNG